MTRDCALYVASFTVDPHLRGDDTIRGFPWIVSGTDLRLRSDSRGPASRKRPSSHCAFLFPSRLCARQHRPDLTTAAGPESRGRFFKPVNPVSARQLHTARSTRRSRRYQYEEPASVSTEWPCRPDEQRLAISYPVRTRPGSPRKSCR